LFLSTLLVNRAFAETPIPSRQRRVKDPATEFELLRLTDPTVSNAVLPPSHIRSLFSRNNSLIYCSDESGSYQVYRMDLKSGQSRPLSSARELEATLVAPLDERSVAYVASGVLEVTSGDRPRQLHRLEPGWVAAGLSVTADGRQVLLAQNKEGQGRLSLIDTGKTAQARLLVESPEAIEFAAARPRRSAAVYLKGGQLWLVDTVGSGHRRLRAAPGVSMAARWSNDGRHIFYLSQPSAAGRLTELRQHTPDTNEDKLVAATSQYVGFTANADSSVFVGVSGSKASPYVLLLTRVGKREMTLVEHRVAQASRVNLQISSNSQWLYFHSDREGKFAIYGMRMSAFLEDTEEDPTTGEN
jgi:oligogalacturonide lyase